METTMATQQIAITGNTYPVKDALKALGAKWNQDQKCWMVSEAKAAEAKRLVENASRAGYTLCLRAPTQCVVCGHKPRYGDRYDRIYKSGECRDCYEERKMGY
jgi:predicted Zn-ribbon and HTH transcriptional regulator